MEDYHHLTDDEVIIFYEWIYGDKSQKLEKSTNMVVKAIDSNAEVNQGKVNCLKIRIRIISGVVHMTFKNHVTLQSYKSFLTERNYFCYTYEATNRSVFCGLILLKLALGLMKTQLIVNV